MRSIIHAVPRAGRRALIIIGAAISAGAVIALLQPGQAGPPPLLDRQAAIEIAMDVINPATLDHDVTAFIGPAMLVSGDEVQPFDLPQRAKVLDRETWFCWINDDPNQFFQHDTRYVFIDAVTGDSIVFQEGWWPEINGTSVFMSDADWLTTTTIVYSTLHVNEP
jgi:hypothetical protein